MTINHFFLMLAICVIVLSAIIIHTSNDKD